ncbi:MAG: hypothetical protein K2Y22_14490 [Candidatus Obscuribacterales bacterium]|nr:hypothetical protein [Candidatus Obscuribacterales bacterium]
MFNSTTLRSVMSVAIIAVVMVCTMQSANACETTKAACPVKAVRPVCKLLNGVKHLFTVRKDTNKTEPVDNADYVTDDASELIITP